ncbi:MAG: sigma-54 dependent transcriptional regulator [Candidatus Omnitrophota bacterium]
MENNHILIVDDEPLTRKSLFEILKFEGYRVSMASGAKEAWDLISNSPPDIIITDLKMPEIDGIKLLRMVKGEYPQIAVVLVTAYGSIENAVEAMKEGAFDYVTKPILDSEIKIVIKRIFEQRKILNENIKLKEKLALTNRDHFHNMIGRDPAMQKIYNLIETVASTNASVLVHGESGTGKRLIAHAIHNCDQNRKSKPFIEVSCGALPESLLESELFGHIKGSFTGAIRDRKGRFEAADGGTIFLDEIDAFSPKLQVKLLRVFQEGDFERVGDTATMRVDVRIITATNQDLRKLMREGAFRHDLYYRLNVIPVYVPALRERKDDIELLVDYFLHKSSSKLQNKDIKGVSRGAMARLCSYSWPGNIRELENVIERAVILCKSEFINEEDVPQLFCEVDSGTDGLSRKDQGSLKDTLKDSEKEIIEQALFECNGNRKRAAQNLGINRTTLYNKMREFGLINK